MASSFERVFYDNRTTRQRFYLRDADGDGVALAATDEVRFKIGRSPDSTPVIDLVSGSPSDSNYSGIEIVSRAAPAEIAVTVGEGESIDPGAYDAEIIVVDDSVASPTEDPSIPVSTGIVHVIGTMGGDTGKDS